MMYLLVVKLPVSHDQLNHDFSHDINFIISDWGDAIIRHDEF